MGESVAFPYLACLILRTASGCDMNAGVLIFPGGTPGNLFLDPMVTDTDALMNILQIDFCLLYTSRCV